jgi:uncharacterized protein YndB with AHSA1/START domain
VIFLPGFKGRARRKGCSIRLITAGSGSGSKDKSRRAGCYLNTFLSSLLLLKRLKMFIKKSITISKPRREVYDYLKLVRNQDHWSVWNMRDPGKKVETKGEDGTVGFTYAWDSKDKNVGAGTQEIKKVADNQSVECELRFERPMKNVAISKMTVSEASPTQTKVDWSFDGPVKFPMNLFSFVFKRMLGKDMQHGLDNLKGVLEKKH